MYRDKDFADWTAEDFLSAYDDEYKFSEDEVKVLSWGFTQFSYFVTQEEGYDFCFGQRIKTVIKVKDRYFAIIWERARTAGIKHNFTGPVYEVKPVKKIIEVTEWEIV